MKACRHLQGRYYAGRMLNVEFSQMITWRSAVCGTFDDHSLNETNDWYPFTKSNVNPFVKLQLSFHILLKFFLTKNATGLSFANKCPKGRNCNFLHLFKNPRNKYPLFDKHRSQASQHKLSSTRREAAEGKRDGTKDTK